MFPNCASRSSRVTQQTLRVAPPGGLRFWGRCSIFQMPGKRELMLVQFQSSVVPHWMMSELCKPGFAEVSVVKASTLWTLIQEELKTAVSDAKVWEVVCGPEGSSSSGKRWFLSCLDQTLKKKCLCACSWFMCFPGCSGSKESACSAGDPGVRFTVLCQFQLYGKVIQLCECVYTCVYACVCVYVCVYMGVWCAKSCLVIQLCVCVYTHVYACVCVYRCVYLGVWCAKSCLTLCNPLDCSLPGSSVRGIFQTRIQELVAIFSSRASSWPKDRTCVSFGACIASEFFTCWAMGEAPWVPICVCVCVCIYIYAYIFFFSDLFPF